MDKWILGRLRRVLSFTAIFSVVLANVSQARDTNEVLAISVTNRFGDVFTNLTVVEALPDGLLVESRAGQMKLKYESLPKALQTKYRSLAETAASRDREEQKANAAFLAQQNRLHSEEVDARYLRLRAADSGPMPPGSHRLAPSGDPRGFSKAAFEVLNGGKIYFLTAGTAGMKTMKNEEQVVGNAAAGLNGFGIQITSEPEQEAGGGHQSAFEHFWSKRRESPGIDAASVRTEETHKFIKVSYTIATVLPNVAYYFSFKKQWVEVHTTKTRVMADDNRLFAEFERQLDYH
jgi:hypothetical protein